jgi:low temperature requirement protein LtrA
MGPRDRDETHRAATPLELLFDLCFVVAVAQAADRLHHALLQGRTAEAVVSYVSVFFAIWWTWMNFTYRGERAVARFSVTAFLVLVAAVATPPLTLALTVALIGLTVAGLVAADIVRPPRRRAR